MSSGEATVDARSMAPTAALSPAEINASGVKRRRVLAIANQKGGVGKSTTAVSLGACLAEAGESVLIIDLDPQGNATSGLGVDRTGSANCVYSAIIGDTPLNDLIEPTAVPGLFIVPATLSLAGAEVELVPLMSRERRLLRALAPARKEFDFTIVDCPPSLGLLTINALAAADEVLIPVQCEYYALEGLGKLLETIRLVKTNLNSRLKIGGVLLTMYDARTRLSQQVVEEVTRFFKEMAFQTVIPRSVRLSEAPGFGLPITVYDGASKGSIAYRQLTKEVILRAEEGAGKRAAGPHPDRLRG